MSSDESKNDLAAEETSKAEAPGKRAAKKATKKRAVKKAAKKRTPKASTREAAPREAASEAQVTRQAEQADMFTPGEISPREAKAEFSGGDEEVTFSSDIKVDQVEERDTPQQSKSPGASFDTPRERKDFQRGKQENRPEQREAPLNQQESKNSQGFGVKKHGGGHKDPPYPHPNDRQKGGGNKFNKNNKNKRKRGKNRWQNKGGRREREDDTPIEFGELFDWELLDQREAILKLADELKSGSGEALDYYRIYTMELPELREEVAALELKVAHAPGRDQLINAITEHAAGRKQAILTTGVLELLEEDDGGLLVYERDSYRVKALSAYVPQVFIDYYGLQRGHIVKAQLNPPREGESCPVVVRIEEVMGQDPETLTEIVPFTERVPYYPTSRILLESNSEAKWDNLSMRVVDCLTPVGFGQRGLIVAPPRTGKTVLMQGMANSIQKNYPDAHLIILLIDERPEEVTDFRRQVKGEVISSTFDESAESHVHAAEMVIEKARRMVEVGKDVVILLDSITRLARAYNTTMPNSGKILSGGVEANALQKPKRFFGSARNIEDGGSLTIIATALVETGSKMDEVIFEEFKGTGNMELHLDRGLSDKRIFPALSMDKSGTRKEELLYHPDEMLKIYSLRRAMKGLPSTDAMEMLIQRIKKTSSNAEFLMSVAR